MSFFSKDGGDDVEVSNYSKEHTTFDRLREMMPKLTNDWIKQIGELDTQLAGAYEKFSGTAIESMGAYIKGAKADIKNYKDNWQDTERKYNEQVRSMQEPGRWQADASRAMQDQSQAADQAVQQARRSAQARGIDVASDPGAMANELSMTMAKNAAIASAGTNQYNDSEMRAMQAGGRAAEMGQAIKESGYQKYGSATDIGSVLNTNALNTAQQRQALTASKLVPMGFAGDLAQAQAGLRSREFDERMSAAQHKAATSGPSDFGALAGMGVGAFTGNAAGAAGTSVGSFVHDGGAIPDDMNTAAETSAPTGPEFNATLEQGEYVIPKEVVTIKGTEFFDNLVAKFAPQKAANQAIPARTQ